MKGGDVQWGDEQRHRKGNWNGPKSPSFRLGRIAVLVERLEGAIRCGEKAEALALCEAIREALRDAHAVINWWSAYPYGRLEGKE